jgi:eukaryotic-like serine/threonine-protein kinase
LPDRDTWPLDVSSDGRWILYGVGDIDGNKPHGALWVTALAGNGTPEMLIAEADDVFSAQFSPDGKWIAFDATVSGHAEVYVSPRPAPGERVSARWQLSSAGGRRPRWRGDGREIFYTRPDGMVIAASVDGSGSDFRISAEVPLFPAFQRLDVQTMDVTSDGQGFIINTLGGDEAEPLAVITNWTQTLKQP